MKMSKISCDIIKDLLPLYIDGVCSSDSIDLIEEHLKDCPLCEAEFMNLQNNTDIKPEIDKDIVLANEKSMYGFLRMLREKHNSVDQYLRDIGISEYEIQELKSKLI